MPIEASETDCPRCRRSPGRFCRTVQGHEVRGGFHEARHHKAEALNELERACSFRNEIGVWFVSVEGES